MKKAKPVIIFLIKLLISGGLLAYFLSRIHIERFFHTFASAKFSYIALALAIYLVAQGISAVRWAALARPIGIKTPFKDMVRYYLIGMFFNLFAPGTVGGDVSRVYYLVRDEEAHANGRAVTTVHAAMSVLMDRAVGLAGSGRTLAVSRISDSRPRQNGHLAAGAGPPHRCFGSSVVAALAA